MKTFYKKNGYVIADGSWVPINEGSREYRELLELVSKGEVEILPEPEVVPSESETKTASRRKAEQYITFYFSTLELVDMLKRLGASPNAQLVAVNAWVESVQTEAITNWQNPNFQQFGNPPYNYEQTF